MDRDGLSRGEARNILGRAIARQNRLPTSPRGEVEPSADGRARGFFPPVEEIATPVTLIAWKSYATVAVAATTPSRIAASRKSRLRNSP